MTFGSKSVESMDSIFNLIIDNLISNSLVDIKPIPSLNSKSDEGISEINLDFSTASKSEHSIIVSCEDNINIIESSLWLKLLLTAYDVIDSSLELKLLSTSSSSMSLTPLADHGDGIDKSESKQLPTASSSMSVMPLGAQGYAIVESIIEVSEVRVLLSKVEVERRGRSGHGARCVKTVTSNNNTMYRSSEGSIIVIDIGG